LVPNHVQELPEFVVSVLVAIHGTIFIDVKDLKEPRERAQPNRCCGRPRQPPSELAQSPAVVRSLIHPQGDNIPDGDDVVGVTSSPQVVDPAIDADQCVPHFLVRRPSS
jgi:hypothetical protein